MSGETMENYNREFRNQLGKYLNTCMGWGFSIKDAIKQYSNILYSLEMTGDPYEKLCREYLISVMYLDAYKLFLYRQKECLANDDETDFLGQLTDIYDLDNLLAEVNSNQEFLMRLIEACYHFREMGSLGKMSIIKSLSDSENEWILKEFPNHEQDLESYDIEVHLEHILKYIKNQTRHQIKDVFFDFKDAIMLSVMGFIRNLTNYDYGNAERLLLEIAQKDYSACECLAGRSGETEEYDLFLDHIDLYENYSRRDILNELIESQEFLHDAIWNIAHVYVYQEYDGGTIQLENVDDCKDTEVMKKLAIK